MVWFGEAVPMIEKAAQICAQADIFVLIGTSLAVYPAAGLIDFVPKNVVKYIVDPKIPNVAKYNHVVKIEKTATDGIEELMEKILL